MILINLNLPPADRIRFENIILLGVIPGPNAPQEIDTFLRPLIDEMKLLFNGIDVLDGSTGERFTLRAHIALVTGDLPALSKLTGTLGVNAQSYCRFCEVRGYWY